MAREIAVIIERGPLLAAVENAPAAFERGPPDSGERRDERQSVYDADRFALIFISHNGLRLTLASELFKYREDC